MSIAPEVGGAFQKPAHGRERAGVGPTVGIFYRRCWAYVVGNCAHVEVRKFVVAENLYEEAQEGHSHFEILARMGKALGLSRKRIEFAKPLPTTVVATHAWETLTKNRTWYEGLAAKSVLERTHNPNCGNFSAREAERWMRQLKLSKEATEFWWISERWVRRCTP